MEEQGSQLVSGRVDVVHERLSVRNIFLIAFIIGSLSIAGGVLFQSTFLSIIVPVLLMFGYYFSISRMNPDLPAAMIGDSYYYLGFTLTLVALICSLLSLSDDVEIGIRRQLAWPVGDN